MGENAGRNIGEAFTCNTAAGGTEAGEVVLARTDVTAPALFTLECEIARLHDHLEEGIVPTNTERFAVAHVLDGDFLVLRREARIAILDEGHQAAWRHTRRHRIHRRGFDGRQALCSKACGRQQQNSGENASRRTKRHTTPNSATRPTNKPERDATPPTLRPRFSR